MLCGHTIESSMIIGVSQIAGHLPLTSVWILKSRRSSSPSAMHTQMVMCMYSSIHSCCIYTILHIDTQDHTHTHTTTHSHTHTHTHTHTCIVHLAFVSLHASCIYPHWYSLHKGRGGRQIQQEPRPECNKFSTT